MSARNRTPDDRTPDLLTFFVRLSPRQFAGGMELGGIVPTKHLVGTPPPMGARSGRRVWAAGRAAYGTGEG